MFPSKSFSRFRWDIEQLIISYVWLLGIKQNAAAIDRHHIQGATDVHHTKITYTGFYVSRVNSIELQFI